MGSRLLVASLSARTCHASSQLSSYTGKHAYLGHEHRPHSSWSSGVGIGKVAPKPALSRRDGSRGNATGRQVRCRLNPASASHASDEAQVHTYCFPLRDSPEAVQR
jgi:hypothetical protein